mmetsp:Transcript_52548/g.152758  ORF Transcript_52548/g.152758 Transcript_52548/m.152758 type:complete len:242 (+) Transcript_52548:869-1594(+)
MEALQRLPWELRTEVSAGPGRLCCRPIAAAAKGEVASGAVQPLLLDVGVHGHRQQPGQLCRCLTASSSRPCLPHGNEKHGHSRAGTPETSAASFQLPASTTAPSRVQGAAQARCSSTVPAATRRGGVHCPLSCRQRCAASPQEPPAVGKQALAGPPATAAVQGPARDTISYSPRPVHGDALLAPAPRRASWPLALPGGRRCQASRQCTEADTLDLPQRRSRPVCGLPPRPQPSPRRRPPAL